MKIRRLVCAVAILCCASSAAFADGTVFVQGIAKPHIPDQSALITFDGKMERLVIETAVEGEGMEFAWVVPVPSMPKVEAATPGLFPTLRAITGDRLIGFDGRRWFSAGLAALLGILIWWGIARGQWIAPLIIGLILCILAGMMLAAPTSVSGVMSGGVNVLDRKIVGLYETVTISGTDGKNIADWLNSNGFKVPSSKQDALMQYAKEGWMFVAGRIRRDSAEAGRFSAHPISFTFATSRAVYPMRLTGIENGPVAVDLYAVGNDEAAAAPFARRRAARLDFNPQEERDESIPVLHETLRSYCKGFAALTVLSATLSPEQMKDDFYLAWKPLTPFRQVYFMEVTALEWAWHIAAGSFLILAVVCAVHYRRRYQLGAIFWKSALAAVGILVGIVGLVWGILSLTLDSSLRLSVIIIVIVCSLAVLVVGWRGWIHFERQPRPLSRSDAAPPSALSSWVVTAALLAPILLGIFVYRVLPKAPDAQVLMMPRAASRVDLNRLTHEEMFIELGEMNAGDDPAEALAAYRKEAASIIAGLRKEHPQSELGKNYLSGLPYAEEDSPGNYAIELKDGKPTYFYFDGDGRKIELGDIGEKARSQSDE
ncbi:MAG: DUF2330 domain-containing protein [Candidatus Brocadiia bacterium]|jgi:hypothetical protein